MYVSIYLDVYVYKHTLTNAPIFLKIYIYIYIHMCIYIYMHTHTYMSMEISVCMCIFTFMVCKCHPWTLGMSQVAGSREPQSCSINFVCFGLGPTCLIRDVGPYEGIFVNFLLWRGPLGILEGPRYLRCFLCKCTCQPDVIRTTLLKESISG